MNRKEHLMWIVAEECNEVAQRVSKASRFGMDEIQPGQDLDNRERIFYEFADLCGALEMLQDGCIIEEVVRGLRRQIDAKKVKVEKYLKYAESVGTLDKPEGACCASEKRSMCGGCESCVDPSL